jgi:hypothetical protein
MSSDHDIVAVPDRASKRPRPVDGVLESFEIFYYSESNKLYDVKCTYCLRGIKGCKPNRMRNQLAGEAKINVIACPLAPKEVKDRYNTNKQTIENLCDIIMLLFIIPLVIIIVILFISDMYKIALLLYLKNNLL